MDASIVNFLLTLFIAAFTVTGVMWLELWASGQATFNVTTTDDTPTQENK